MLERTGNMNFYGRIKYSRETKMEFEDKEAIKNIQEIGATYLTNTYTKLYQFFALSMIAIVALFGASYFIGTATAWFPYFGVAFLVLLASQFVVHIAFRITFTEITKELISGGK